MNSKQFNEIVENFQTTQDQQGANLEMHDLLIKTADGTYAHNFRNEAKPSDVRSISKTILTLALGRVMFLADAGNYPHIDEESEIYPIIKEVINLENTDNLTKLKQVKIKHLITHTVGYEDVLLMRGHIASMDSFDLLDYVVNYPIVYEPGAHYLYSNAGFYLLSVVLEEFIQEDLTSFLARELFSPLGIEEFQWEKYGKYLAGATRLWVFPDDLVNFAGLFLNQGEVKGEAFIAKDWLDRMLTATTYTKELDHPEYTFRRYAYGYGTWLAKDSFYFGHGTDGQRLIMLPKEKMVILTLAEQGDTEPIDAILNKIVQQVRN